LEVRVKIKTLNKRFLGANPSIYLLLNKKKICVLLPLLSPLPLGAIGSPLPLVFLLVFFIEDNENLKHGGER